MKARWAFVWGVLAASALFVAYLLFLAKASADAGNARFDLLPWLGALFDVLGKVDWWNALGVILGFALFAMLVLWQLVPGDGMDFRMLLADWVGNGHGQWVVRPGKCWQAGAFIVTTWVFVKLGEKGGLSEFFLLIYAVAWIGSPVINRIVAAKYPVPDALGEPAPAASKTTTVNIEQTEVKP